MSGALGFFIDYGSIRPWFISLVMAGFVWIGVLWIVTLAMHLYFDLKRRRELIRLKALRKRFPNYGYRPKNW